MKRFGSVIGVRPERIDEYKELHAAAWPEVLRMIAECNIRNYSIFLRELDGGRAYLFAYFEYHGTDLEADMARMAADPVTQRWWSFCQPCQQPLEAAAPGQWWVDMEEVFHAD